MAEHEIKSPSQESGIDWVYFYCLKATQLVRYMEAVNHSQINALETSSASLLSECPFIELIF